MLSKAIYVLHFYFSIFLELKFFRLQFPVKCFCLKIVKVGFTTNLALYLLYIKTSSPSFDTPCSFNNANEIWSCSQTAFGDFCSHEFHSQVKHCKECGLCFLPSGPCHVQSGVVTSVCQFPWLPAVRLIIKEHGLHSLQYFLYLLRAIDLKRIILKFIIQALLHTSMDQQCNNAR